MSQLAKKSGVVAVDCVVICCCCPCIVLQITVFLFISLPQKLAVKSKRIILKKIRKRLRRRNRNDGNVVAINGDYHNTCYWMEFDDSPEMSNPLQSDRVLFIGSEERNHDTDAWIAQEMNFVFGDRNNCLQDENAWRDMLGRGTFWFGSFWANGDHLENCAPEFNGGADWQQWRGREERGEQRIHAPSSSRTLESEEIVET